MEKVTLTRTHWTTTNNVVTGHLKRSFNVKDSKGRDIGARVCLFECDIEHRTQTYECWVNCVREQQPLPAAGHAFAYRPSATRAGMDFGACAQSSYFPTAAERDAAVEKYFKSAQARAVKKAA